ncbi:MAG: uncharacterized protein QOJ12_2212 [Thermoleophilales bacterium]|nr:uncharacterized protein [Thermoleophilales bacterium]
MLGAGGGGDTPTPLVMALLAVDRHGPVQVVGLDDLAPDAVVMPCGLVGSAAVAEERLWSGDEGAVLADAVAELRGRPVDAVMCFQIGGAGGLLPVAWAARLGLPLVDADGMGRAFPGLQHQAMRLGGVPASPVVLTDGRGSAVVVRAADDSAAERLAMRAAASLGGVCAGAVYCMTGDEARSAAIGGSLSRALEIGTRGAPGQVVLFEGRVVDLEREVGAGSVGGSATLTGMGADAGRQLRLELQNQFLLAIEDGAVRAAVPDVVCVLGTETREPVSTGALRYGDALTVVALPAPAVWRSQRGLELAGPRAFGYDVDYELIAAEALHGGG